MKKSLTSVGLSLCMILSLTPVMAIYADELDAHDEVMDQEIVEENVLNLAEEEEPVVEGESEEVVEKVESELEEELEAAPMMLEAVAPVSSGLAIDETNFPDANFRNYVLASFDSNGDEKLDDEEIANVKYIHAPSKTISSLKGIEYFTELEGLDCDNNQLASLDVSKNTKLVKLICSKNALTSLNTSHNPLLKKLDIYNNKITSIDVSQNTELETLYIGRNPIETLNVKNNVKLMELQSELNDLTSIDLSNNSPSMTLYMANNIYPITVGKGRSFDLSKLPAGFDVSKTSNWQNATVNSGVLIVKSVDDFVTYDYDCGNGHKVKFKFRVYSSIKQVSVPWAKYKYLYMNFYTYNGKEQVGVDAREGYTLSGVYKATKAGKYEAKLNLLEGYEWEDGSTDEKTIKWEIREAQQDTPGGLQGVAPSSSTAKYGKITGTTSAMRYRKLDGLPNNCDDGETTNLEPGEYVVWYVKKTNYDASPYTHVIVPEYGDTTSKIIVRNGTVNGSDSLIVSKSDVATLVAKTSPFYEKEFDKWVVKAGKATIKDVNSPTTTITNVGGPVTVEAVYKDKLFKLNVINGTGSGSFTQGTVVTIKADTPPAGKVFWKWEEKTGSAYINSVLAETGELTIMQSNVTIEAVYKDATPITPPGPAKYALKVDGGIGSGEYGENSEVIIKAYAPELGKEFDKWELVSGDVVIEDVNSAITKVTTKAMAANIRAVYKESSIPAPTLKFDLIVKNGTGSGTYEENEVVSIKADPAPAGEEFDRWMITSGTATFGNFRSPNTTITIKDSNVKIEALYKKIVPVHTHTYGAWVSDDTNHWRECTDASCSSIKDKAVHVYDNDMDDTCNVCGYKRVLPTPVVTYKFIEGANSSWTKNSGQNLIFKANGEFSRFTGVKVDGTLIGNDKYSAVSGSTVVTLKKDYLETLSVGKHTLTVVYTDSECTTEFQVKAASATEDTKPGTEKPINPEEDKKPGTEQEKPGTDETKPGAETEKPKPNIEKPAPSKVDKKKDVKSEKKKSLNTAYSDNMGQWMVLLLMSGFVLVLSVFKKKRN
mgnify:CR=1 FL=1